MIAQVMLCIDATSIDVNLNLSMKEKLVSRGQSGQPGELPFQTAGLVQLEMGSPTHPSQSGIMFTSINYKKINIYTRTNYNKSVQVITINFTFYFYFKNIKHALLFSDIRESITALNVSQLIYFSCVRLGRYHCFTENRFT